MKPSNSIHALKTVLDYYFVSMHGYLIRVFLISILGLTLRLLSILTFALIIKIFLSMFDQEATTLLVNNILAKLSFAAAAPSDLWFYLVLPLAVFTGVQYFLGKFYLLLFRNVRGQLMIKMLTSDSHASLHDKASFVYDYFLHGFEALIKSLEIILFYLILILFIFIVNFTMGVSVVILVPILVFVLVFRDRKEAFVQDAIKISREIIDQDKETLLAPIKHYDQQLNYRINGVIASELFGGMALVIIFMVYVKYHEQFMGYGLLPLLLIFAIRFAVLYAGELSRQLSVVFRLRAVLK